MDLTRFFLDTDLRKVHINSYTVQWFLTLSPQIYLVHAKPEDYLFGLDGRKYDRSDYYQNPQHYRSTFAENVSQQ